MNWLGFFEGVGLAAYVVVCWVLAHQNAAGREPMGRRIAAGYGICGLAALLPVVCLWVPQLIWFAPFADLLERSALLATLGMVTVRLKLLYPFR